MVGKSAGTILTVVSARALFTPQGTGYVHMWPQTRELTLLEHQNIAAGCPSEGYCANPNYLRNPKFCVGCFDFI